MSELEQRYQQQIEELLGRPLVPEELSEVSTLAELSVAQRDVARLLAKRQAVLCSLYLRSIAPIGIGAAKVFIDELCRNAKP